MSKKGKEKNYNKKSTGVFLWIFTLLSILVCGTAIYEITLLSSIEDKLRYIGMGVLGVIALFFLIRTIIINKKIKKKANKKGHKLLFLFMFLYIILCAGITLGIYYVYGKLDSINKKYVTYESNLIVLSSNSATKIEDIKNMKIGILSDDKSPDGYIIPMEMVKENNLEDDNTLVDYDDYMSMIVDLYQADGTVDALFVPDNYVEQFNQITGYENIATDTRIIISKSKEMLKSDTSKQETASSGKSLTEPFTILLMGIDSTDEVLQKNAIANGDTLILITFNPKTLNATMLSIPRDSFVPIACWPGKERNKITHAAGYGTDCMINTIEQYFDTDIDYYAKINFKGLVKLVDAVGGVDINVEQTLCTDNSNREQQICIQPGYQTLDGEHALVYARNRKQLKNGDFGRGQHQQEIVLALVEKIKQVKDVSQFMDILNTVSNSVDTNLSTKQILAFYNIAKDIMTSSLSSEAADIINIQRLWLDGSGQMIYDSRMRMPLYDYVPNTESVKDVIEAMHQNLELTEHKDITKFSFSINEPYEQKVIGEGPYRTGYEVVKSNAPVEQTSKTEKENTKTKDEDEEGEGSYTTGNNTSGNKPSSSSGTNTGSGTSENTGEETGGNSGSNPGGSSTGDNGGSSGSNPGGSSAGDNDGGSTGDNGGSTQPEPRAEEEGQQ